MGPTNNNTHSNPHLIDSFAIKLLKKDIKELVLSVYIQNI